MDVSLKGKIAVVCGSTQGIGKAIAESFAEAGATCFLVARNAATLEEVRSELSVKQNQKHLCFVADFSDLNAVRKAIEKIVATGHVHILVNNTGGPKPGQITDASGEDFSKAFEQHIVCNQALVQALLPGMTSEGYGRIINIISTSIKIPLPNLGVSNTIRAAVASWAKTLSNEVGRFNVTVNNILPGFTDTARLTSLIDTMVKNGGTPRGELIAKMKNEIPMKRFGLASELANLATFLASPAASYITGTSIPVDGGKTASL